MKRNLLVLALTLTCSASFAGSYKIQLSPNDEFTVKAPSAWNLQKEEYEKDRSAEFSFKPKDNSFTLTLHFLRATQKLNSDEKLKDAIVSMGQSVLPRAVEEEISIKEMDLDKGFGCYTTFTDKKTAKLLNPKSTDFLYMTRGFIRLSDDCVLGFMMLSHEIDNDLHKEVLDYLAGYIK